MNHLNPAQVVDASEGRAEPSVREHVKACDRCRDNVARAAATLGIVRTDDVPEPSPMFWEHFSRRVREQIDTTVPAPAERPTRRWLWIPAAAALVAVIAIGGALSMRTPQARRTTTASSAAASTSPASADTVVPSAGEDGNWAIVAESAEGLAWEESAAAGLTVRPGAAERAAMELTDDQRQELARLLREEIGSL